MAQFKVCVAHEATHVSPGHRRAEHIEQSNSGNRPLHKLKGGRIVAGPMEPKSLGPWEGAPAQNERLLDFKILIKGDVGGLHLHHSIQIVRVQVQQLAVVQQIRGKCLLRKLHMANLRKMIFIIDVFRFLNNVGIVGVRALPVAEIAGFVHIQPDAVETV